MSLTEALRSQLITGLEDGSIVPYIGAGTLNGVTEKSTGNPIPADSDSLILAVKEQYYPITKAIYALMGRIADGSYMASAMGMLGMVLLACSLLATGRVLGKKMGELFKV